MPKKGFQSITIRQAAYDKLTEIAKELGMSIPEAVAYIALNCKIEKPAVEVSQNVPAK